MIEFGQLVLLVSPKGKRYLKRLEQGGELHGTHGKLLYDEVAAAGFGGTVRTHMGKPFRVVRPTLYDLVKNVKRQTQIIYPKEIGYIVVKLGIGPGTTVVECGSGSGSLTVAMAWFVGPTGKVFTYERRPEFLKLAKRNLGWAGVDDGRVTQIGRDATEGFDEHNADAVFLDMREPWTALDTAVRTIKPGAPLGFLLPTVNQVSDLLTQLHAGPFEDIEVLEILLRRYKTVPDRVRPEDRMVAHTGFLVFCRHSEGKAAELEAASAVNAAGGVPCEDEADFEVACEEPAAPADSLWAPAENGTAEADEQAAPAAPVCEDEADFEVGCEEPEEGKE